MLLWVHLGFALAADVLLVLTAIISLAYLIQDHLLKNKKLNLDWLHLPSIQVLDEIGLKLLTLSFLMMTIGIIAGSLLAQQHWGPGWYLDIRQIWSTATWLLFAVVLLARFTVGWRGRRAALVTLVGVTFVITGLFILNYVSWTKHLAAAGLS